MKVLLVDNGTLFKKKLTKLLDGHEVVRIEQPKLKPSEISQDFDLIILSGADGGHSAQYHAHKTFSNELELISKSKTPIIGICLGAQLIAKLYKAELSWINKGGLRRRGYKRIWSVEGSPIKFDREQKVWASQKWRINEQPRELETWCASKDGVEVFKHKDKQIYGLQFHPEYQDGNNDARNIFNKIVAIATAG